MPFQNKHPHWEREGYHIRNSCTGRNVYFVREQVVCCDCCAVHLRLINRCQLMVEKHPINSDWFAFTVLIFTKFCFFPMRAFLFQTSSTVNNKQSCLHCVVHLKQNTDKGVLWPLNQLVCNPCKLELTWRCLIEWNVKLHQLIFSDL